MLNISLGIKLKIYWSPCSDRVGNPSHCFDKVPLLFQRPSSMESPISGVTPPNYAWGGPRDVFPIILLNPDFFSSSRSFAFLVKKKYITKVGFNYHAKKSQ